MFLQLTMVLMNFYSVIIGQVSLFNFFDKKNGICYVDGNKQDPHTLTINWIVCQVFIFYFNFLSMLIFLVLSRIFKYRTLREKAGLAGNMRNSNDFLEFCQDDIHWITFQVTQLCIIILIELIRSKDNREVHNHLWLYVPISIRWIVQSGFFYLIFYTDR